MKKTFVSLLVAGIVVLAAVSPAVAQGSGALVKVPFEFIVGNKVMPAGEYRFATQTNDWSVVMITSTEKGLAMFTSTQTVPDSAISGSEAKLSFANYYGHYFLQQIAIPGRDAHRVLLTKEQAGQMLAKLNLMPVDNIATAK